MQGWRRLLVVVLTASVASAGAGCGVLRRRAKPADDRFVEDMRKGRRPMGQVMVVDAERRFVLVQSPLAASAPPDSILVVRGQGTAATTGKVKVTPERKKNRVAADIVEGTPKVGEVVYFQSAEKVVSTDPPPLEPGLGEVGVASMAPATGGGTAATPGAVVPPPSGGSAADLPPLGEPSGPREIIPDFPGLGPTTPAADSPLPEAGEPLEELPEPSEETRPSA